MVIIQYHLKNLKNLQQNKSRGSKNQLKLMQCQECATRSPLIAGGRGRQSSTQQALSSVEEVDGTGAISDESGLQAQCLQHLHL